eukprot:m.78983 g.78983  ORF g.78983 m.78983 type:complete len:57 (-) comp9262_c0_seq2:447-617(-)
MAHLNGDCPSRTQQLSSGIVTTLQCKEKRRRAGYPGLVDMGTCLDQLLDHIDVTLL